MNLLVPFVLALVLCLASCDKGKTTETVSSTFPTLALKQQFLERYVNFRRSYEDLDFHISFIDGESGMVAGPTEWNLRVLAKVPADEIDQWIQGLAVSKHPELDWVKDIPNAPAELSGFEWYQDDKRTVGTNRADRTVLYWNRTL